MKQITVFFLVLFFWGGNLFSQGIAIGQWRDHLPYNQLIKVAVTPKKIYAATPYNLFYYDLEDNSINRLTTINGLSDIGVASIAYNANYGILVVAYSNTNIDIIKPNSIVNVSDIKSANIVGNKRINEILLKDQYAYLSCGFGIVVLDLSKEEIKETYYIGAEGKQVNVLDLCYDDSLFYAATDEGIYYAAIDAPNLSDYAYWTKDTNIHHPDGEYNNVLAYNGNIICNLKGAVFNSDTMFILQNGTWDYFEKTNNFAKGSLSVSNNLLLVPLYGALSVYDENLNRIQHIWTYGNSIMPEPTHAIMNSDSVIWIADKNRGLVKNYNIWNNQLIQAIGPSSNKAYSLHYQDGAIFTSAGGHESTWNNLYQRAEVNVFEDESWTSYDRYNTPAFDTIFDVFHTVCTPGNSKHLFIASYGKGLVEMNNGQVINVYNENNSSLESNAVYPPDRVNCAGMAWDDNANLWITNAGGAETTLAVKKANGQWASFNFYAYTSGTVVNKIIIDNYGQKWITLPRNGGILVFDDNGTIDNTSDDKIKKLTSTIGSGNLPSMNVYAIAEDHNGRIWIGTDEGIAVIYSPENVFNGGDFDAQQILVEQDGYVEPLFEKETVTAIAVDGSNKKWIGTDKAGVFLISENGAEQIQAFDKDNSPLFSNSITDIAIHEKTGEIFFATYEGLISYKGKATTGEEEEFSDVLIYPNPVPSGYNGYIGINGLITNAHVKITDISGDVVYECFAEGGQAVWDGNTHQGRKVSSGIYLVFASNEDGSEKFVGKILFIQ
jgi:hypothetical protein